VLRAFLLVVSLVLMAIGLWPCMAGARPLYPPLIWGGVLCVATVLERWRYRSQPGREGAIWEATDERFIDPESGKLMQVYYQPQSGERRYEPVADKDLR
jgi:hypothetical protein